MMKIELKKEFTDRTNTQTNKNSTEELKNRLKRYKFQVIRNVHHRFTIRKIKMTLLHMNIRPKNLNRVGNTIFLGIHSEWIKKRVEENLDEEVFTEEHYRRLYRR